MSWKSIELQVALPRTQDAGKMQEQMLKQSQHFQESLVGSQLKQEELKRQRVNDSEETNKMNFKKEDTSHSEVQGQHIKQQIHKKGSEHPYLGNRVDFSG